MINEIQSIAAEFYEYYDKKEKFGLFLGLIKRRGNSWAYIKLSEMRDYFHVNNKKMPIEFVMKK
jgi:hypothetical protein